MNLIPTGYDFFLLVMIIGGTFVNDSLLLLEPICYLLNVCHSAQNCYLLSDLHVQYTVYHSAQDCYFWSKYLNKVVKQEAIDLSGIPFGIVCCNEATVTTVSFKVTTVRGSFSLF